MTWKIKKWKVVEKELPSPYVPELEQPKAVRNAELETDFVMAALLAMGVKPRKFAKMLLNKDKLLKFAMTLMEDLQKEEQHLIKKLEKDLNKGA